MRGTQRPRRFFSAALGVVSLPLLSACSGPDPGNSRAELRAALDAAYPEGWRFASLDPDARAALEPGESAEWIGGDFDGDGRSDYAAQLVIWKLGHTTTMDSAQLIVALLRRRDGFHRDVVSVGGGPSFEVYLARIPRGARVADFEGGSAVTLESDAVHQIFAGKASVAHVYEDGHWREILTGD
jgi:hypothetical protein